MNPKLVGLALVTMLVSPISARMASPPVCRTVPELKAEVLRSAEEPMSDRAVQEIVTAASQYLDDCGHATKCYRAQINVGRSKGSPQAEMELIPAIAAAVLFDAKSSCKDAYPVLVRGRITEAGDLCVFDNLNWVLDGTKLTRWQKKVLKLAYSRAAPGFAKAAEGYRRSPESLSGNHAALLAAAYERAAKRFDPRRVTRFVWEDREVVEVAFQVNWPKELLQPPPGAQPEEWIGYEDGKIFDATITISKRDLRVLAVE